MNVFILAAGRGTRLRPLTDHCPKPLLAVDGHPVIDHTLARLRGLPVDRVVVNVWHLADMMVAHLTQNRFGSIVISRESQLLETGGGICNALNLLDNGPFLAINGDILWDFNLTPLTRAFDPLIMDALLVLVPNPPGKKGDFVLLAEEGTAPIRRFHGGDVPGWTYSGIQMLNPSALSSYPVVPFSMNRFYDDCLHGGRLFGMRLAGAWSDIGTPENLAKAREEWKFPLHILGN